MKYAIVNYSNSGVTLKVGMTPEEAREQCGEMLRSYATQFNSPLVVNVRWTSDVNAEATVLDGRRVVDRLALGIVTQKSPEWVSLKRQANTQVETIVCLLAPFPQKTLNELWETNDEAAIVALRKLNRILEEFIGELVHLNARGNLLWLPAEEAADLLVQEAADADGQE